MASAVRAGKIRAVGISNCSVAQMRKAADVLARYDIPLAANQVQYSLLHRKPETDGVLDACRRMDVALVAYRPIGGGALSSGPAKSSGRSALADTLREVAAARSATAAQVALAWLLKRDDHVIPIPGATRPEHVRENAGALSLDAQRRRVRRHRPGIGADAGQVARRVAGRAPGLGATRQTDFPYSSVPGITFFRT